MSEFTYDIMEKPITIVARTRALDSGDSINEAWDDANAAIGEVMGIIFFHKKLGPICWGYEDQEKGLYFAGFMLKRPNAMIPEGWVKTTIPAAKFMRSEVTDDYYSTYHRLEKECEKHSLYPDYPAYDNVRNGKAYIYMAVSADA